MAETLTIKFPDEETHKKMWEAMSPFLKQINETAALQSLLYDIDLMPEQVRLPVNVGRMIAICELFKRIPPEAIKEMFGG